MELQGSMCGTVVTSVMSTSIRHVKIVPSEYLKEQYHIVEEARKPEIKTFERVPIGCVEDIQPIKI